MRHDVSVTINAPEDRVWHAIVSVQDWPQWTPTVDSAQRLDEGPLRVGSRTRLRQPRLRPAVWTVTELREGESFTWTTGNALLRMTAVHTARKAAEKTEVSLGFAVSGPLARPVWLLAGRTIHDYVRTEATSLRTWCERVTR